MPGFSFAYDPGGLERRGAWATADHRYSKAKDAGYRQEVFVESDVASIVFTTGDNYRVRTFDDGRFAVLVDGLVYGKTPERLGEETAALCEVAFSGRGDEEAAVRRWILDTDGEFAVVLFDRESSGALLFNDRLGRLSVYCRALPGGALLVSRNPWNLLRGAGDVEFDRAAIAEYLLLGYPLGPRTVMKDVSRLEGASLVQIDPRAPGPRIFRLHAYDFDDRMEKTGNVRRHAGDVVDLLREACGERVEDGFPNVLALSGGLDSRTVATCLADEPAGVAAVTFLDYYGMFRPDVEYAERIAATLGIERELVNLPRASGADVLDLLRVKCGMNYLGVGFSLPMIERIKNLHGKRITLFTGDGGDRVLRDTAPARRLSSLDDLAAYTITYNAVLRPGIVAAITGVPEGELFGRVRDRLASFPERDLDNKYLQFVYGERCPGWHFEGEDRNRAFVRHVTPFYAAKVFEYSARLPRRMKLDFRLYREVLRNLSPAVAAIANPEWRFPITSRKLGMYGLARRLYFHLPAAVRSVVQRRHVYTKKASVYPADSPVRRCLESQLRRCEAIAGLLSRDGIAGSVDRMEKMGFDHFFTLTSLIELASTGSSSIEDFLDSELF